MKKKLLAKKNFLKESYKSSFKYVAESKNYIYFIIGIFTLFLFFGFILPLPDSVFNIILEFIEELLLKTQNMSHLELIGFIFLNNLQSTFFGMVYGIILGIFSILTSAANGYLLGFVAYSVSNTEGILVLWKILPHGIFELPALFISLGLGLKLGSFVFKKDKIKFLKIYFLESFKVFFFVIIPLLIIAAIIEGTLIFFFS